MITASMWDAQVSGKSVAYGTNGQVKCLDKHAQGIQLPHYVLLYDVSTSDTPTVRFHQANMERASFRTRLQDGSRGPVGPIACGSGQGLVTGCDSPPNIVFTCTIPGSRGRTPRVFLWESVLTPYVTTEYICGMGIHGEIPDPERASCFGPRKQTPRHSNRSSRKLTPSKAAYSRKAPGSQCQLQAVGMLAPTTANIATSRTRQLKNARTVPPNKCYRHGLWGAAIRLVSPILAFY
jgi:hypothetical protein